MLCCDVLQPRLRCLATPGAAAITNLCQAVLTTSCDVLQARDGYLAELEELIPTMEALVAEKISLEEQAEQMKAQLRDLQEAGHEVCLGC